MKIKLNDLVIYKKNKTGGGLLFSINDTSDKILRVNGLVDTVAENLFKGIPLAEVRSSILAEYDVTVERLDADLVEFKKQLEELSFLDEKEK